VESWSARNDDYLAASLRWLRLRLRRLAPDAPEPPVPDPGTDARPPFRRRPRPAQPVPGGAGPPLDEQLAEAATARDKAAGVDGDPPPALLRLAELLGLTPFERDTLLLCVAMELDPSLGALCARAHGDPASGHPTFGLAMAVLDDPRWDALAAHRPLRYWRLTEVDRPGATPLTAGPLRADERVVNYVKGLNVVDDRLATMLDAVDPSAALAPSQDAVVAAVLAHLRRAAANAVLPVVQLVGADDASRVAVARHACAAVGRRLHRIAAPALPAAPAELDTLARLWQREGMLLPVALYVDVDDAGDEHAATSRALHRFLSHEIGLVFLGVRESPVRLAVPTFPADVRKPAPTEQRDAWAALLAGEVPADALGAAASRLAGQFDLSLGDIGTAAALASRTPSSDGRAPDAWWDACRDLTRPRLDALAQRLDPKATWDELVLPDEQTRLVRRIAGQVRERHRVYDEWGFARRMNRGFGITALFAGESGTGKTMAAEVLANDLRLDLYRIDLSAVVSKYIGETEKNLRRLFDAAELGGAILLFDEADALFGKRSEVKDSHDRYANIEVNYLLQRMEAFNGLAILATNMRSALDPAFLRRLRFVVTFPFPGAVERRRIWERALPPETPADVLDHDRLARLTVSGGNIHSIALNAAFLAAEDGGRVTMPLVLAAAWAELRKLDKPVSQAEFR
jgi:hypothetical protein